MKVAVVVLSLIAFVAGAVMPALPGGGLGRIAGGEATTIESYPFTVAMLHNFVGTSSIYVQRCGGSILTERHILSAANCYFYTENTLHPNSWWRVRAGATAANSGGSVVNVNIIAPHPGFDEETHLNDLVVIRTAEALVWGPAVQQAQISGGLYVVPDGAAVTAIGYGNTDNSGTWSEVLRHVTLNTIPNVACASNYPSRITEDQLCSVALDGAERFQCFGDRGSPLLHGDVVVGVFSWGPMQCGISSQPGINIKVSSYIDWILSTVAGL